MRRVLFVILVLAGAGAYVLTSAGAKQKESGSEYTVEFDNAFGLVKGGDVKVAGVRAGKISKLRLDKKNLKALVDFKLTREGFGSLRSDVTCESRPQSLIGEYFIDCTPGKSPTKLKPGATIPVDHTTSTIPADLINNIMRRPYRERLRIILNELGAGVGGRAEDLNATIRRASPALRETDKVLQILGNQNQVLKDLTTNADVVVGDLAKNRRNVGRFVKETEDAATASAERRRDIAAGLHRLPTFLRELKPTLAELGATADASTPYLRDLNASAGQLERFLDDLGPFAESSRGNVRSLAKTADAGRPAIRSARPTVAELTKTTEKAPELANNLEIVLRDLDDRGRAVEKDKRSPGGQGYTGFEAVLSYIFDQMMAINVFDENGYILKVNLSASECSEYQNADSIKRKEKESPGFISRCLAGLGPNQPGVTTADPTDTGVEDPGHPSPKAQSKKGKKGKKKTKQQRDQEKSKNAPGQPDLKKALEKLLKGGGGGNVPNVPSPALPNVQVPNVPLPNVPVPNVPGVTNGSGQNGQSVDPNALLDYLLSP
jgi:phospholipid/cholesterol/gamma-HCH transport system substrate-binding protein